MAASYAARLTKGVDYGVCGLPETKDSPRVLAVKLKKLVELFKTSKHIVVHTGAGVSTSCGIPDFRGPSGVWTLEKQGRIEDAGGAPWKDVVPSVTHMALAALAERGIVKYVVTQNVDGLHLKSGFTPGKISELHGNVFRESCEQCQKVFVRDFDIQTIGFAYTGRKCDECGGKLIDFLLDWEDALPEDELERAVEECKTADLAVCLGTSLRVTPANSLPLKTVKRGGKLVIVNLQATPKDKTSNLKISATCDEVLCHLMKMLEIPIPSYKSVPGAIVQKKIQRFSSVGEGEEKGERL
mmetsp:Transcript_12623/g.14044  ORF Transcript_12623/g.14044 Transcript_12623/m.14044 type:complete len:298 (+) Transcript_12623:42-935(+)